jgi:hypothetical protein
VYIVRAPMSTTNKSLSRGLDSLLNPQ